MAFLSNSSVAIIQGNITGPSTGLKIIGGTSPTSDLFLQTTSGTGTTGADMHFLVGNNGATEAMTILNSGNVGIGTTSPSAKLSLKGAGTTTGRVFAISNSADAEKVTVLDNGNFGIGTTAPGAKLESYANTNSMIVELLRLRQDGAGAGSGSKLSFQRSDGEHGYIQNQYVDATLAYSTQIGGDSVSLQSGGTNRLTVASSGNVGIGTVSPTAYLNIKAGTATASTAPLKLTSGTVNTTAETGAIEYNGTNLSFVPTGTLRENIFTGARGSITLTAGTTTTVTVAQAKTTSTIMISPTSLAVIALTPYVSTKNNGSFVITTLTAAGTETLDYIIVN